MDFIKHDKLVNQTGEPNRELISYNARRYQLNQIACCLELVASPDLFHKLASAMRRLQRIHMGASVTLPHWSSLITWKE